MNASFIEKQKFTQWWLWLFVLTPLAGIAIYGAVKQLIMGIPVGDNPMPDTMMVFFIGVCIALIILFATLTLHTEINEQGITMRYVPFIKKQIPWSTVFSAEIVKYGFVGYGIRLGTSHGTVYNTNGDKGLAIKLKNGKRFLIGTQRAKELQIYLDTIPFSKENTSR